MTDTFLNRRESRLKKGRVFVVVSFPPDSRDKERFGLKGFQEAGYVAELIDMSQVFFPSRAAMAEGQKDVGVTRVCTLAELSRFVRSLFGTDLIILATYPSSYTTIRQLLGMKLLFSAPASVGLRVGSHSLPVKPEEGFLSFSRRLTKAIDSAKVTIQKAHVEKMTKGNAFLAQLIAEKLLLRSLLPFKSLLLRRKADYVWFGTKIPSTVGHLIGKKTRLLRIHHLDYDKFLEVQKHSPTTKEAGIVWIDPMGPFHPDILESRIQYDDPKTWINEIRSLLKALESTFGVRVSVAAHPRSTSQSLKSIYRGFDVFRDQTYRLVRHSTIVVSAGSTALGWGALHEKPMLLAMSRGEHPFCRDVILAQSAALRIPVLYLPSDLGKLQVPSVDRQAYASYVEEFLRPANSRTTPFWTQVIESIESPTPNRDGCPSEIRSPGSGGSIGR